jgi:hypothetical protein
MGSRLEAVVEGLLEPLPEDRLSAEDALSMLSGTARTAQRDSRGGDASSDGYGSPGGSYARRRPAGSKIVVKKQGARLEIDIPPSGLSCVFRCCGGWQRVLAFPPFHCHPLSPGLHVPRPRGSTPEKLCWQPLRLASLTGLPPPRFGLQGG